jgi:hypothetical protein
MHQTLFEPSSSIYLQIKAFHGDLLNGSFEIVEWAVYDHLKLS